LSTNTLKAGWKACGTFRNAPNTRGRTIQRLELQVAPDSVAVSHLPLLTKMSPGWHFRARQRRSSTSKLIMVALDSIREISPWAIPAFFASWA